MLWTNCSPTSPLLHQSLTLCTEIGPEMLEPLAELSISAHATTNTSMHTAASWLLCSFIRAAPHLAGKVLSIYGKAHGGTDVEKGDPTVAARVFRAVGLAFQSKPAVEHLLERGLLQKWMDRGIELSGGGGEVRGERFEISQLLSKINIPQLTSDTTLHARTLFPA